MDGLLESFVRQQRMKLPGSQYILLRNREMGHAPSDPRGRQAPSSHLAVTRPFRVSKAFILCYNGPSRPPRVPSMPNLQAAPACHRCPQPDPPAARGPVPAGLTPAQALIATRANPHQHQQAAGQQRTDPCHRGIRRRGAQLAQGDLSGLPRRANPHAPGAERGSPSCRMPSGSAASMPALPDRRGGRSHRHPGRRHGQARGAGHHHLHRQGVLPAHLPADPGTGLLQQALAGCAFVQQQYGVAPRRSWWTSGP